MATYAGGHLAQPQAVRIIARQLTLDELRRETALMEHRYRTAQGQWTILKRELKRRERQARRRADG